MNTQKLVNWIKRYPLLVISFIVCLGLLSSLFMRSELVQSEESELAKHLAEGRRHGLNIANSSMLTDQIEYLVRANEAVKERSLLVGSLAQNLQYFYRLEADIGVKYSDLRPGGRVTPAKDDTLTPLNYIVSVQGDFVQIITFLRHLERGAYFSRVNTAVVSTSGSLVTLNLNLDLLGTQ